MTEKKITVRMPLYYKEFQCIGGSCEDNCCIGWDVEIDKTTYQQYQQVKDKELSKLFKKFIYKNPDSYAQNVDYAIVELTGKHRCPFLNEQHLCKIQAKLGHGFLSNVCSAYPRYANEINGIKEYSVNVSCPEAARLVLTNPQGIVFVTEELNPSSKTIVNFAVKTAEHAGNYMIEYFSELRDFTISVLQNRKYLLWERILILGHFYEELQQAAQVQKAVPVQALLKSYAEKIGRDGSWTSKSSLSADHSQQYRYMKEITNELNRLTAIDSYRYIRLTQEFSRGIGILAKPNPVKEETSYCKAYEQYYEPFMKDHAYLLENYLVNYVFGGLLSHNRKHKAVRGISDARSTFCDD